MADWLDEEIEKIVVAKKKRPGISLHRVKVYPRISKYDLPIPGTISIMELTSKTCRWPYGVPGKAGFGYCGKRVNYKYCKDHDAVAFNPNVLTARKITSGGKS